MKKIKILSYQETKRIRTNYTKKKLNEIQET